jgi:hypothetical protein
MRYPTRFCCGAFLFAGFGQNHFDLLPCSLSLEDRKTAIEHMKTWKDKMFGNAWEKKSSDWLANVYRQEQSENLTSCVGMFRTQQNVQYEEICMLLNVRYVMKHAAILYAFTTTRQQDEHSHIVGMFDRPLKELVDKYSADVSNFARQWPKWKRVSKDFHQGTRSTILTYVIGNGI